MDGWMERGGRERRRESKKEGRREGEIVRSNERVTSIVSSNAQANPIHILVPILINYWRYCTEDFK